ncbi:MAG: DUF3311 domain-containing protein [Actinomycetota bacterium]|nr:DUF3311 domain-containing protein [Actinomycetota bacterium]
MSSPPSERQQGRARQRPPIPTGTKLLLAVLLAVPVVLPLWIPLYDRETPELGGIPFFFWFQFALIPVAALLTWTAFVLVVRHENRGGER